MRKTKGYLRSLERKQRISGMRVVGIDPAKDKHQAVVFDAGHIEVSGVRSLSMTKVSR